MKRENGFTLIELLVVIAIISLLSSIVLAWLNSAREKGRLAAAKQFSQTLDHDIGAEAVGWWDADECQGTSLSSNTTGSTGALSGGASWQTDTPSGLGCSLLLNGTNGYVALGNIFNDTTLKYTMTTSAWFKANAVDLGPTNRRVIFSKAQFSTDNRMFTLGILNGTGQLTFEVNDDANTAYSIPTTVSADGRWHHVAGVWDNGKQSLYLDGKLVASATRSFSKLNDSTGGVFIGAIDSGVSGYFSGYVDGVRVFASPLTASAVQKMYAEGLPNHTLAEK